MFYYNAFNQQIISSVFFPELSVNSDTRNVVVNTHRQNKTISTIQIIKQRVSSSGITNPKQMGPYFQADENYFWLHIPDIGRFLVVNGKQIIVDPKPYAEEATFRAFILDTCMKALLKQQGYDILEGCAIKVNNTAILFTAPPGYGKSTFAAAFYKKGYTILSEEICVLDTQCLIPSYPVIHLWKNIFNQLQIQPEIFMQSRPGCDKYYFNLGEQFDSRPIPYKLIYQIEYHKKDKLEINAINAERVKIMCPRWHYSMYELGLLVNHVCQDIENDMLIRTHSNACTTAI